MLHLHIVSNRTVTVTANFLALVYRTRAVWYPAARARTAAPIARGQWKGIKSPGGILGSKTPGSARLCLCLGA
jgi:hypothetical protein